GAGDVPVGIVAIQPADFLHGQKAPVAFRKKRVVEIAMGVLGIQQEGLVVVGSLAQFMFTDQSGTAFHGVQQAHVLGNATVVGRILAPLQEQRIQALQEIVG